MEPEFSRGERMSEQIRQVLARLIQTELADPNVGMVSIGDVELSKDFRHAKIFVSALELAGTDTQTSVQALNHAAGFLRRELGRQLRVKNLPRLRFIADDTQRKAVEMDERIRQARAADDIAGRRRGDDS